MHYIRSTRANGLARAVCGIIVGAKRRTTQRAKVTCKRCRQLAQIDETWAQQHARELRHTERKPPKRVEVRMPTASNSHRAVDALLGKPGERTVERDVDAEQLRASAPPSRYLEMREKYAGAIGLLCMLSTQLRDNFERDDHLDSIEAAVQDFCKLTGWSYRRVLHRIEVFPPTTKNEG